MREKVQNLKDGMIHAFQLPDDFSERMTLLSMKGQKELRAENFKAIVSFTPEEICLLVSGGILCISGCCLMIREYCSREIEITGIIHKIEFK